MARAKSKVLSVRLTLEALQSCFDFCELVGSPTNGASGAIARTVEGLTMNLRSKQVIPTYSATELEHLVSQFMSKLNPTSSVNLEKLSYTNADFAPSIIAVEEGEVDSLSDEIEDLSIDEEYADLIEEQIRERMKEEETDLLAKIMM